MAANRKTTATKVETIKPSRRLNPYDGYYVSAFLRGIKFRYKGSELDARNLNEKQLEMLAADDKFKHITKRKTKS